MKMGFFRQLCNLKSLSFGGKGKWRWGDRWNGTKVVVVVGDEGLI